MKKDSIAKTRAGLEAITVKELLKGERVELRTPPKEERQSVLSIRIKPEVFRDLEIMAREHGESPSTFARSFILEGLARKGKLLSAEELASMLVDRLNAQRAAGEITGTQTATQTISTPVESRPTQRIRVEPVQVDGKCATG